MAARPLRTGIVQQALPDVLPDGALTVEADSVHLLYLDGPAATPALHSQKMVGNFVQPHRGDGGSGWTGMRRPILEKRLPVFRRQVVIRSQGGGGRGLPAESGRHLFHLFDCRHAPAGRLVHHKATRT